MEVIDIIVIGTLVYCCEGNIHRDENVNDQVCDTRIQGDNTKHGLYKYIAIPAKKAVYKKTSAGLDLPFDALTLHHSFIHYISTEFEYSQCTSSSSHSLTNHHHQQLMCL